MDECYTAGMGAGVPDKPTILDIGANAGYFSLFALSRFPGVLVLAFELLSANFRLLEHQQRLNDNENIDSREALLRPSGFKTRRRPVGMFWAGGEGQ